MCKSGVKEQLGKTYIHFSLTTDKCKCGYFRIMSYLCIPGAWQDTTSQQTGRRGCVRAGYPSKRSGQGGVMYRGWCVALRSASEVQKTGNYRQKVFFCFNLYCRTYSLLWKGMARKKVGPTGTHPVREPIITKQYLFKRH